MDSIGAIGFKRQVHEVTATWQAETQIAERNSHLHGSASDGQQAGPAQVSCGQVDAPAALEVKDCDCSMAAIHCEAARFRQLPGIVVVVEQDYSCLLPSASGNDGNALTLGRHIRSVASQLKRAA